MRLAVVREGFGGANDAMTYAALARVNGWDVAYYRNPPLTEEEAPGIGDFSYSYSALDDLFLPRDRENDSLVLEPAELGYWWTRALCDREMWSRVFPLVWQNLPFTDTTEHTPVILQKAAGFLARSSMACELLRLYGVGHARIHLCHAAVDAERFCPGETTQSDRVRLLFAGRPVPEKGIAEIIWALLALPAELRDKVTLVMAGGAAPEVDGLQIESVGAVPHHQMPALYQSCDVFLYPTYPTQGWLEQWGLSVVEAMACGLPVITTDVGAFREILPREQHHWMIPARDWVSLRDRLASLIENVSLRRTLGAQNRAHVVQHFDGRETAKQYAKAFGEEVTQ